MCSCQRVSLPTSPLATHSWSLTCTGTVTHCTSKSAPVVAVGLVFSWMSSWVWLNVWLKCTEESAETCTRRKSKLILVTRSKSPIWTKLKWWWTCSLMSSLSANTSAWLPGFSLACSWPVWRVKRGTCLSPVTCAGPDELRKRGSLKDKQLF